MKAHAPTYGSWKRMRQRCHPVSGRARYAGRGITVCERWNTFANFLADMGERQPGMTIERIDNDKGYEPGNCKWIPKGLQTWNRSPTRWVVLDGERIPMSIASIRLGHAQRTVHDRVFTQRWPIERALDGRGTWDTKS